jgi:hypothetical protein
VLAPLGGWHLILGDVMVFVGIGGTLLMSLGAVRRDRGRR